MRCHICKQYTTGGQCRRCLAILTRVEAGDESIEEIHRQTGIGRSSSPIRTILKKMEEDHGLVTSCLISEREDRQRRQYWLTEQGKKHLEYLRHPSETTGQLF